MRRTVVLLATAALGLIGPWAALADESIESGPWTGSALDPGPTRFADANEIGLSGSFTRTPYRTFDVEVRAERAEPAPMCQVTGSGRFEPDPPSDPTDGFDFAHALTAPCNGTYLVEAVARTTNNLTLPESVAILDRTVTVVVPPPDVTAVDAVEGANRAVTVSWAAVSPRPADHLGYLVVRTLSDGSTTVFEVGDVTQVVDSSPPAAGGAMTYAVVARRSGATSGSEVRSVNPTTKTVTVSAAPAGSGGSGTGGTGRTPASGGTGGTGGSGGAPSGPVRIGGRPSGGISVPRVGTPSRNFFPPLLAPPVEDTGFDAELPFEDREPGEEEAIVDDELAGDLSERLPGRGLVVPLATGLVLAVWGLHLRFLARAGRPVYVDGDRIEILQP
jgi:hypothetical protein